MKLKHPEAGLLFWQPVVPLTTVVELMEARVCSRCGWSVERDQRRCHRCGRRLWPENPYFSGPQKRG